MVEYGTAPINLERAFAHHGLKMEMPESRAGGAD